MKQLNRYDFTNDKSFATFLLDRQDTKFRQLPDCDVIGLERINGLDTRLLVMRPDEALILARLLIDAVWQVTEGYTVGEPKIQELELTLNGNPVTSYRLVENENGERRVVQLL